MFLNPAMSAALDRIAERAADVRRAFEPGAFPLHDDVASEPVAAFTLDPLSVASARGELFVTAGAGGAHAYTADGSFHLEQGRLLDARGDAVLGSRVPGGALEELRVDPVDAALGRASDARIEPDGTFAYDRAAIDPRTGRRELQRVAVGRLALARFPAGTRFAGGDGLAAPAGVVAHVGVPGDGTFAALEPHRRLRGGIDIDRSLVRLKEAYVAFDALQAAHAAKGRTAKTAMDLLK